MRIVVLESVKQELDSFGPDLIAAIDRASQRLIFYGGKLGMPHSKQIRPGLYELRIKDVRIFYALLAGDAYFLRAFVKKQDKIPTRELHIVLNRLSILQSYNL